jgi:two-component system NtrC family sensor kinase
LLSRWSIQHKLLFCVALLCLIVATLAISGFRGVYSYRQLARTISIRASELPLAGELSNSLGDLRVTLSRAQQAHEFSRVEGLSGLEQKWYQDAYCDDLEKVEETLAVYRQALESELPSDPRFGDRSHEFATLDNLERSLAELQKTKRDMGWLLKPSDPLKPHSYGVTGVLDRVDSMYREAATLPKVLHDRMDAFAREVKLEYRTWIVVEWVAAVATAVMLAALLALLYVWVVAPLRVLIAGSRRIAQQDDFDHRIYLRSRDEMAELASALNDMTARFQQITAELDEQVQQRTQEVVRGEQLASVGFLAAGVAHEINNPLASIAWCAESLESRLHETLHGENETLSDEQEAEVAILRKYLRRIQDEAFRCKGITERLLDFSRLGDVQRQNTDLAELVQGVIDMVKHLGKYRHKHIEFDQPERVIAAVNVQELKQVVLNLVTNALDSLDPGGTVSISVRKVAGWAELVVRDNGCGMSEEVLKNLFEPFFTRRRDGSGTGLGLSITYRIITDHGGTIEPASDGVGKGSRVRVLLPLQPAEGATSGRPAAPHKSSDAKPAPVKTPPRLQAA